MIERTTGKVHLPNGGLEINPLLTRDQFLASPFASQSRELVRNEPHCSFALPTVQFEGHLFALSLQFYGSVLQSVSITRVDKHFGSSWADWSEQRELARKNFHDSFLQSVLGVDWNHNHFSWGKVESTYDPRSGSSSIFVRYANR